MVTVPLSVEVCGLYWYMERQRPFLIVRHVQEVIAGRGRLNKGEGMGSMDGPEVRVVVFIADDDDCVCFFV